MYNKRKCIGIVSSVSIIMIIVIGIVIHVKYKDNGIYIGNGIPYIISNGKNSELAVFNQKGMYKEKIGSKEEVFWFASSVYEDETISVDNRNKIYRFTEEEMESFSDVESNIMAVLKVDGSYIIISESSTSVCISLYSEDFAEKIDSQSVPGTFEYCFVEEDTVYYSVSGDEEQFTGVYAYCLENNLNEQVYSSNVSEEIYPFVYNTTLYLAKNKLITELNNIDILELYEMQDNGSCDKVMDLSDCLKKVLIADGSVYGLAGTNSTIILKINLQENKQEELFTLVGEEALGLYYIDGKVQILTNYAVYILEENQLIKQYDVGSVELMNEFF